MIFKVGDLIYDGMDEVVWHKDNDHQLCCPLCGDTEINWSAAAYSCGFSGRWEYDLPVGVLSALRIKTICNRNKFVPTITTKVFPEKFNFISK